MAYNLKSEEEVKEYLKNLGIEYRFGCYSEKNPEVCHLLGDYTEAIDRDYKKAAKIYKTNCDDTGYFRSCYKTGAYLLLGRGLKQDFAQALSYFSKSCQAGHPEGCYQEGALLVSDNSARGIPQDLVKGMERIEKACLEGSGNACHDLSSLYIRGVRKNDNWELPKDMKKAFQYAERGCQAGNIFCCVNLSQMYTKGDGVPKNEELGEKFKQLALELQEEIKTQKTLTFQQGLD